MDTYKVITAVAANVLEDALNNPDNQGYEIASVTGSFQPMVQSGSYPETGVTVILKRKQETPISTQMLMGRG